MEGVDTRCAIRHKSKTRNIFQDENKYCEIKPKRSSLCFVSDLGNGVQAFVDGDFAGI
jgi:hypothetical protein